MKNTLSGIFIAAFTFTATAASVQASDPAKSERCHAGIRAFDPQKGKYVSVDGEALLLDGNEITGRQFSAGRNQFIISLAKSRNIDRLSIIGSGSAKFTVSVSDDDAVPGAAWQPVLKNVKLSGSFGSDRPMNRTARYILIETDARSIFTVNEFAVYGQLAPIGAPSPRYLTELWEQRRRDKAAEQAEDAKLPAIKAGPNGFFPGRLGFPPRATDARVMSRTQKAPMSAPRGILSAPPKPAVR